MSPGAISLRSIHPKRPVLLLALLLLALLAGAGQPREIYAQSRIPPQVKFKATLPTELEKLGYINRIIEDATGYLWFGTIKGLARYDGYGLRVYQHDENTPNTLSHPWVKHLLLDHQQQLWVVTHTGLCRHRERSDDFECFTGTPDSSNDTELEFFYLFEDSQQRLWASTSQGVRHFSAQHWRLEEVPEPLHTALKPTPDSEAQMISIMVEDANNSLWFGLNSNGILHYDSVTNSLVHYHTQDGASRLPSDNTRELLIDSRGELWVGSLGGGVSRFDTDSETFTRIIHSHDEKADTVWDIVEDRNGLFWIGDGTGVHLYDPITGKFVGYEYIEGKSQTPGNFVARDLYIDSAEGVWVGYFPSGVDRVDLQASEFSNYVHDPNDPDSLADGGVLSTALDALGNLWVGCGFGLSYLDRSSGRFKHFRHDENNPHSLSGSTVLDLHLDDDDTLWVGAWDRGLNRRDPASGKFRHYLPHPDDPQSLLGREPWAITRDTNGVLWVVTEKGVNRYNPDNDNFTHVMPPGADDKPVKQLYSRHINATRDGKLWIASFDGLFVLDPVTNIYIAHFKHDKNDPHSLSWDQVLTTFEDSKGKLWVGTFGGGLDLFDPALNGFKHFGLESGLPNLAITGIIEDASSNIWVSTYQGLARLDPEQQRFTAFDKSDGLVNNLFNRNSPSRLATGELVFGSSRGLTIFDPGMLKPNDYIPPVVFTQLQIFNQTVLPGPDKPIQAAISTGPEIHLNHKQSMFSLEFAALDYRAPSENQYAYRLLGFERDWNYVGNRRQATYTNLDPGYYEFEVRGSNDQGVWNPEPARISINVAPPYWKTPLAYFLYLLAVITLLGAIYRAQRLKLQQQQALLHKMQEVAFMKDQINCELDQKVAERTEELEREHERLQLTQRQLQTLNKKLDDASITDQLTGLKNRRFLHRKLQHDAQVVAQQYELATTRRQPTDKLDHLSFLVVDIDDFKRVNDRYGHAVGDKLLIQFSSLLQTVVRDDDYVVRWGGEEFVIVIRHLNNDQVDTIASRLLESTRQQAFDIDNAQILQITCSIGIARFPFIPTAATHFDWEQVINLADQALYVAKSSGKDCWVRFEAKAKLATTGIQSSVSNEQLKSLLETKAIATSSSRHDSSITWNL